MWFHICAQFFLGIKVRIFFFLIFCLFLLLICLRRYFFFFYFLILVSLGFFIFLAVLNRFEQITNPDDICTRYSSFRNRSWLLSWLLNQEEKEAFLSQMIDDFIASVYSGTRQRTTEYTQN